MDRSLQQALGRNLRVLRRTRGLSQEAMAERLDLHRTYVGGLERGERNVTLRTVEQLGTRLGVHPLDLLWDRDEVVIDVDGDQPRLIPIDQAEHAVLSAADDGQIGVPPRAAARRRRPLS